MAIEEPRKLIHCIKVGIAMTLVSLYYYSCPWYDGSQETAMWAVITVVVVFEFTVGGCLYKGLNRAAATLSAGALALGVHWIASKAGERLEPIILGVAVFFLASLATFSRFVAAIKTWFDYGVTIFLLTFSLVAVSGYRNDTLFDLARQRMFNIAAGIIICLLVCILICPVWAGEDLHLLVACNLENLAATLESGDKKKLTCVLGSKSSEESLANLARWEPPHGRFGFQHPWKQYLKISDAMRRCAYRIEALNGCFTSQSQVPELMRKHMNESFARLSSDCARVLKKSAYCIRAMRKSNCTKLLIDEMNNAAKELDKALRSLLRVEENNSSGQDLACIALSEEGTTVMTGTFLWIEMSARIRDVAETVNHLAEKACFKAASDHEEGEDMLPRKTSFVITLGEDAVRPIEEA